jgi:uroporphyrinogen decarboxylase
MTSRERILAALRHQEPDRVAIHDSLWKTTIRRWVNEGLPEKEDPTVFFDYEIVKFGGDITFRFPEEILQETDEYIVVRDPTGAVVKNWKNRTSTPEKHDFLIASKAVWDRYKDRLIWDPSRINTTDQLEQNRRATQAGKCVNYSAGIGYDYVQGVIGTERLLIAMIEEPDWCREMFETFTDLTIKNCQAMLEAGYHFDSAFLYDDNGYRNGLLFSNTAYQATLFDTHKRLCDYCHSQSMPVILHSCGNVTERIDLFIKAGFDCLQPIEVKAGMDLIALKRNYGDRLAFMGGIDARKMSHPDPAVIEEEIRTKFEAVMPGGGYIYHSDHSVPDDVSFKQYQHVIKLVRKYGEYR